MRIEFGGRDGDERSIHYVYVCTYFPVLRFNIIFFYVRLKCVFLFASMSTRVRCDVHIYLSNWYDSNDARCIRHLFCTLRDSTTHVNGHASCWHLNCQQQLNPPIQRFRIIEDYLWKIKKMSRLWRWKMKLSDVWQLDTSKTDISLFFLSFRFFLSTTQHVLNSQPVFMLE